MRKILVLICAIFLVAVHAPAQLFKYLDTQDGLSSRRVLSIEKDKKGYMWFLTHEGADRYNGKQYKHYQMTDGNETIQHSPNLNMLQTDQNGNIWALGKDGRMFQYNADWDVFQLKLKFTDSIQSKKRLPLTLTKIDRNDNLWLCTKSSQYIYEIPTGDFYQLESEINEEITCLAQADENHYYIGTTHSIYYATLNGKSLHVEKDSQLENFHIIHHLYFHQSSQNLSYRSSL